MKFSNTLSGGEDYLRQDISTAAVWRMMYQVRGSTKAAVSKLLSFFIIFFIFYIPHSRLSQALSTNHFFPSLSFLCVSSSLSLSISTSLSLYLSYPPFPELFFQTPNSEGMLLMTKACELLIMEIAVKACVTAGQGGKNVIEVCISQMDCSRE